MRECVSGCGGVEVVQVERRWWWWWWCGIASLTMLLSRRADHVCACVRVLDVVVCSCHMMEKDVPDRDAFENDDSLLPAAYLALDVYLEVPSSFTWKSELMNCSSVLKSCTGLQSDHLPIYQCIHPIYALIADFATFSLSSTSSPQHSLGTPYQSGSLSSLW